MLQKFMEDCVPWEGPHTGVGRRPSVRSPEEGVAETMGDELITAPAPCSHEQLEGRTYRKMGLKLRTGRWWGGGRHF